MSDIEQEFQELRRRADERFGSLAPTPSDLKRIRKRRALLGASSTLAALLLVVGAFSVVTLATDGKEQELIAPSPTPSTSENAGLSDEVIMAFGSRDDIWIALSDGTTRNVTKSPEVERNPTISFDGEVMVYERETARASELVYLRFDTGESASFADGNSPTFGPLGYLAWTNEGDILVGSPFGDDAIAAPSLGDQRWEASNLAWDQSLELLYYDVAQGHGTTPFYMDVIRKEGWECAECGGGIGLGDVQPIVPDNARTGEIFVGTTLGTGVDLLKLCCATGAFQEEPWQSVELGSLDINDVEIRYHRQRPLSDVALDRDGAISLDDAGQLAAEVQGDRVRWDVTNSRAWFVLSGTDAWLVRYRGDAVQLPYQIDGGIAVNPPVAGSPFIHSFDD